MQLGFRLCWLTCWGKLHHVLLLLISHSRNISYLVEHKALCKSDSDKLKCLNMKQQQYPKKTVCEQNNLIQSIVFSKTGAAKTGKIFLNFTHMYFLSRHKLISITNNWKVNNRLTEHDITNQLSLKKYEKIWNSMNTKMKTKKMLHQQYPVYNFQIKPT